MHVLAIQTTLREKVSRLPHTLAALEPAGLESWAGPKLIVADGYTPEAHGWIVDVASTEVRGSSSTFIHLLTQVVRRWPDVEQLTYLQDDISMSKNALRYIERFRVPADLAFVAWFSQIASEPGRQYLRRMPTHIFFCSQAITLTRLSVDTLLKNGLKQWPHRHLCDVLLQLLSVPTYAIHVPSIAEHDDGGASACGNAKRGPRKAPNFAGLDFDALTLEYEPDGYAPGSVG
jgi:hypothetical protein